MFAERMRGIKKSGIREIFDLAQTLPDHINLGIGEPDFRTPSFVRVAARKAMREGFTRYTSNVGIPELREAIALKLKRENRITVDPSSEVIVTAGATQSIFILMNILLNPGDEIILPSPLFTAYKYCATLAGARAVEVPLDENDGYSLDPKKIERAITKKSRVLVLNSPCNPTGAVYTRKQIEETCRIAANNGMYVISDEIYEKFLYDGAEHFSPASKAELKNSVITINGLSKTFAMTGWRIGYTAASADIISMMTLYNMYNAVCASSFVQSAAASALEHSTDYFNSILRRFARRRDLLCRGLAEIGFRFKRPMGAFFVFASLPGARRNSLEFCKDLLLKKRVSTVPGSTFGEGGEGHIRLSYSVDERKIRLALGRIQDFVRGNSK